MKKEEEQKQEEEKTIKSENILVCNKGNMILEYYKKDSQKIYNLRYNFNNLDPKKVNIKALFNFGTYELLEKINPDLIEKIFILNVLNVLNENEVDICIFLKPIAKEIGIKQKYILFRSKRIVDYNNNSIVFYNKDLSLLNEEIKEKYLKQLNVDINKYEALIFNYGITNINIDNLDSNELIKLNNDNNFNNKIDINFNFDFEILISDDLPIYMENFVGLMFKKMFYNLKQFIDNLNK